MRRAGAALALLVAGCAVGQGNGYVQGPLTVTDCTGAGKNLIATMDHPYDMQPQFFAGEPIRDLRIGSVRTNRLIIRIQKTGRQRELNDVLRFDIPNVYDVARCVRGPAQPGYDEKNCVPGPDSVRIRVAPDSIIRSYFTPRFTCAWPQTYGDEQVGTAIAAPTASSDWTSWIDLQDFGGARDKPVNSDFFVDFGQRLRAAKFHVTIEDDRVVRAAASGMPPPTREIGGVLEGSFDFDLDRGQGAQTFP